MTDQQWAAAPLQPGEACARWLYRGPAPDAPRLRVSLETPRPEAGGRDWECRVVITGDGLNHEKTAHGVDSVQALMEGLRVAAILADQLEPGWSMFTQPELILHGQTFTFDHGFPTAIFYDLRAEAGRKLTEMHHEAMARTMQLAHPKPQQ